MNLIVNIDDSQIEEKIKKLNQKIKEIRELTKELNNMPGVKVTLASEKADAKASAPKD